MFRRVRFAGLLFIASTLTPASAQKSGGPSTIVGIGGSCQAVILAGKQEECSGTGAINMIFPNGHALFMVGINNGRSMAFVGEKDSQPRPEVYTLYLSRVRIVTRGSSNVINVAGQCVVRMSADGKLWSTLECDASDENDLHYTLDFKSNGTPVHVSHTSG